MCILIGYFVNLFSIRIGEIIRCTILKQLYPKVSTQKVIGTVIAERIIDLVMLVMMTSLLLISNLSINEFLFQEVIKAKDYIYNYIFYEKIYLLASLLGVGVIVFIWLTEKI